MQTTRRRVHTTERQIGRAIDGKLRFLTRIAIYEIAQRVQRAGDRFTMSARARASMKQSTKQKDGGFFFNCDGRTGLRRRKASAGTRMIKNGHTRRRMAIERSDFRHQSGQLNEMSNVSAPNS